MMAPLLDVKNLKVSFFMYDGELEAIDDISFHVRRGEIFGLVGESGSGKSVTAFSILGVLPDPGKVLGGEVLFDGDNLLWKSETELRTIRGRRISMILQNPRSSLNPLETVGAQLSKVYQVHMGMSRRAATAAALDMLSTLGMPDAESKLDAYPYQLSGGMCQRVLIAMMLAPQPDLLIADEPTTALDVTIEAQILEHITRWHARTGSSVLYITHDMGVIAQTCNRVAVMHAGHIVEMAPVELLFGNPLHPYTVGLLRSILRVDRARGLTNIKPIPGTIPSLVNPPVGCRFSGRCSYVREKCLTVRPAFLEAEPEHWVLCQEAIIREHHC